LACDLHAVEAVLAGRRVSVVKALGLSAGEAEIAEYLDPWNDPRVARSWLALAGAADHRCTMEMLPALRPSKTSKLLVWGENDGSQTVDMPNATRARFLRRGSSGSRRQATFRWKTIPKA
jgi:hypothetical protein